jgi:DNA repair protein RadA
LEISLNEAISIAKERKIISSGSAQIDILLQGGYRTGELVEVFGASKTGKTQLAMQAALSAAANGHNVVFVDTEGTFRPERIVRMAELRGFDGAEMLPKLFCIRAENTRQQIDSVHLMRMNKKVSDSRLVIVDTVSKNFGLEFVGKSQTPLRQSQLEIYLNYLVRDAYLRDRAVILTNRVASIITRTGEKEVDIGGATLRRMVSKVFYLRREGSNIYASLLIDDRELSRIRCSITERGFE